MVYNDIITITGTSIISNQLQETAYFILLHNHLS